MKDPKNIDIDDVLERAANRLIAWTGDNDMEFVRALWNEALEAAIYSHLHPFNFNTPQRGFRHGL